MKIDELEVGERLTHEELRTTFQCGVSGGIRYSSKSKSIVIISDQSDPFYQDYWEGNILHYTGTGRVGDQKLEGANKRLANINNSGISGYLFEKIKPNDYEFLGQVKLAKRSYQEVQLDENNELRKVWMFPLQLISNGPKPLSEVRFNKTEKKRKKKAKKTEDEVLKRRAINTNKKPGTREVTSSSYVRDPYVSEYAKRRAKGYCQLCEKEAPFKNKAGEPYLETHHIEWLSKGGEDSIENTVALCPNCHRKMHVINSKEDRNKLKLKAQG
ncbi:HNH endonuclease [Natroniella sulfidigena]|uniref:HNH endonuclease n=1 Tax=Natroniella sulfidigena TaxID=723921 RepID=UPI00200A160F|nr:HNH endonuclease signature motif containing protein [Natroniella sulfidigena]MCK8816747.1 HNH endonuclease [Natroniella sulfidigena]